MKNAFTLAEVLITLGIIGIVAAMTLPTLIQKQQEKVLINQLKVANNTLSNMLLLAYKDYDTMQFWSNDYSQGSTYMTYNRTNFEKYFLPYLKVAKYCKSGKGCFSEDIYFNKDTGDNINTNSNFTKALLAMECQLQQGDWISAHISAEIFLLMLMVLKVLTNGAKTYSTLQYHPKREGFILLFQMNLGVQTP